MEEETHKKKMRESFPGNKMFKDASCAFITAAAAGVMLPGSGRTDVCPSVPAL